MEIYPLGLELNLFQLIFFKKRYGYGQWRHYGGNVDCGPQNLFTSSH